MSNKPEKDLLHYGVKGMKWGVINEDEPAPSNRSKKKKPDAKTSLTEKEKKVLNKVGLTEADGPRLNAKYGPDSLKQKPKPLPKKDDLKGLNQQQKDAIVFGLKVVGAGALIYGAYRLNKSAASFGPESLNTFIETMNVEKDINATGWSLDKIKSLSDESVNLSAGSILKRISTVQEQSIRPGGFYACHLDADVERYKAVLPIFWKQWGIGSRNGYVVNLEANAPIKAPSAKKTYEMFKELFDEDVSDGVGSGTLRTQLKKIYGDLPDDELGRRYFPRFALAWNDDDNVVTKKFFERAKAQGYNALIDINDMGSLGEKPLRVIDSSIFKIAGHDFLAESSIQIAQEKIPQLVHALFGLIRNTDQTLDFFKHHGLVIETEKLKDMNSSKDHIEHVGVKGMKWGVRKNQNSGSKPRLSDSDAKRQQAAHERRVQAGQTMAVGLLSGVALGMTMKELAKRNF